MTMSEPFWKTKHDWWLEDIAFDIQQIYELHEMLVKHPDDEMGDSLRAAIRGVEKNKEWLCREYKKIYGIRPNLRKIREEVLRET